MITGAQLVEKEKPPSKTLEPVKLSDADKFHFQALVASAQVKQLELQAASKERDEFYSKLWKDSGLTPETYDLDWEKGIFLPKAAK